MTPEPTTGFAASASAAMSQRARSPAWILLRGPVRDRRHWGSLPGRIAGLGPGQVVEAFDLPGSGSRYRERSLSSVGDMVEVLRTGLQRRGIEAPVRLLATSLGTMVAVEWARRHPQEVDTLVLVNPGLRPLNPLSQRLRPEAWLSMLRLVLLPAGPLDWERALLGYSSRRYRGEHSPARSALLERWVAWRSAQPVSRTNMLRQLWAAFRYRAPTAPQVPGLVLVSARDGLVDPRCSHRIAEAWGWPLVEHPKAGHDLSLDDPAWLLTQLRERFGRPFPSESEVQAEEDAAPFEVEEVDDPRPYRRRPVHVRDVTDVELDEQGRVRRPDAVEALPHGLSAPEPVFEVPAAAAVEAGAARAAAAPAAWPERRVEREAPQPLESERLTPAPAATND